MTKQGILEKQCFEDFLLKATPDSPHKPTSPDPIRMLVFDPGETTGFAFFTGGVVTFARQFDTRNRQHFPYQFERLKTHLQPNFILFEDYRVYSWRREQHSWASLHTPKLIGQIEALSIIHKLPYHYQMAHQAKQFCTDDRLKEWGLYTPSFRHARDAIRHGCYYLLFKASHGSCDTTHGVTESMPKE